METIYEDVSVRIEPDAREPGQFRIHAQTPAGSASDPFDPGPLLFALAQPAASGGPSRQLSIASESESVGTAEEVGGRLFRALFSGQVGTLFHRSCGPRLTASRGVRLRLCFDPSHEGVASIAALPWELLYREDTRDFLGLDRRTPVVRSVEIPRGAELPPLTPPLRVLLASSVPADCPPLDLEQESGVIQEAWRRGGAADIHVLERASAESLHDALAEAAFDVVHLMGHGTFDSDTGHGSLVLQGSEGVTESLSGSVLASLLKSRDIRLAIVNACDSGRAQDGPRADFFAGTATSLLLGGVPAVIAMRTPITDQAAIVFSRTFHRSLAAGAPVDAAAAEGRLAIYRLDPQSLEWTIPVLFLRAADGHLFRREPREEVRPQTAERPDVVRIHGDEIGAEGAVIANQIGSSPGTGSVGRIDLSGRRINLAGATITNRKLTGG